MFFKCPYCKKRHFIYFKNKCSSCGEFHKVSVDERKLAIAYFLSFPVFMINNLGYPWWKTYLITTFVFTIATYIGIKLIKIKH